MFFTLSIYCTVENSSRVTFEAIRSAEKKYITVYSGLDIFPKGSGLLLNKNGDILTCYHVIAGIENSVRVSQDGVTFHKATVAKYEHSFDLALLKTDIKETISEPDWIDREDLQVNQDVFSFATPYGMTTSFLKGYISHKNRINTVTGFHQIPFIQIMGISFPGSSGAGVFLNDGRTIGINSTTVTYGAGNGIGFVIPAGYIQAFLQK